MNMSTYAQELNITALAMVVPTQDIPAMDESNRTGNKRFDQLGIPTKSANRLTEKLILTQPWR